MAKTNKKLEKIIKNFFTSLGVDAEMEIVDDKEAIAITLETEDTGMVIGYHGETLEALQLVLSLILAKENGEFKRVSIEAGDYKKNRTEWLERLALDAKERALSQGKEVYLSELKSWERRVVHLLLQDDKEVTSESSGEGKDRVLVIKPK
ncbi:MAG: R3H domain-containing nucleic acid-binding protein [Candidatus Levyibacteriota bacterium]|jgi:spoIIIJ-associated protein